MLKRPNFTGRIVDGLTDPKDEEMNFPPKGNPVLLVVNK